MIKRVKVVNYKSLSNLDVELEPLTVLIGRSGTGKTNFVEALRFLRDFLEERNANFVQNYGGWEHVLCATAKQPLTFAFTVAFDAPGIQGDFGYSLVFRQLQEQVGTGYIVPTLAEEKLELGNKVIYHSQNNKWLHPPGVANPPPPSELALGALTGLREASVARLALTRGIGCYTFPDSVLIPLTGPLKHMMEAQRGQKAEAGLADDGANFIEAVDRIVNYLDAWDRWNELLAAIRILDSSVKSIDLRAPEGDNIVVSHEVNGRLLPFVVSRESEGLRRLLAHLIALYQIPPKQTLIFEEPEKGIHPGALAVLADQFRACPEAGRGQVILTTHSPDLLNHFPPDSLRVVEKRDYATTIGPVDESQVEAIREELIRPGELLTVDDARSAATAASES